MPEISRNAGVGTSVATLAMSDVKFAYSTTAFSLEIDRFEMRSGECVFLRGPSGSGKTTFLSLANGLLEAGS